MVVVAVALSGVSDLASQTDPSGTYRTWTTEHFRIHAKHELADAAGHLAREAERAWHMLAAELVPPSGRIDVTLMDNVDFSNGFATVFPSKRITVFLTTPAGDVSLGHFDDWIRLVITHELVHIFHLDRTRGVWGVLRGVFGNAPGLFPNAYQPSWVAEGLATYYESKYTRAGRVRGGFHGQLLAARAGAGWPDPNDATFVSPAWPAGHRPYAWGSRFFTHQTALYGDSLIPRFVERTARQVWPLRISAPLVAAGGQPLDEAWNGLREAWRGRGGPRGRVLVRGLRTEPRARIGPDGRAFAYVHDDGRQTIHVAFHDPASGAHTSGPATNGDADLAWVGDALYAAQLEFTSPVEILSDLYRLEDGRRWRRLTRGRRLTTPFALPDGRLGVVAVAPGARALSTRDPLDGDLTDLPSPAADDWGRVAMSPDGRWLAGARLVDGHWDLVVWPAGMPEAAVAVTADQALDADPSWTPDGRTVLFTSERFGLPQVFGYGMDTGRVSRFTEEPTGARQPVMTVDGRLIYATVLADGFALVTLEAPHPGFGAGVASSALPLEAAAPVDVAESGYRPWPALRPHYWLPLYADEGRAGTFVGFGTTGSDPIGRTAYGATLSYAPGTNRVEGVLAARYTSWKALTLDAAVIQNWAFAGFVRDSVNNEFDVASRERFISGGVTWRWRRWRSSAFVRLGGELEDDRFFAVDPGAPDLSAADFVRGGPVLSAGWSRAERPPLAISPENGVAVSGLLRERWELGGPERSEEVRLSTQGYVALPLPGFAHWVLAADVRGGAKGGRGAFELGGESGALFEVAPGIALGERRAFPLRSYPANDQRFTWVATGAVELRIPLFLVASGVGSLPLGIDRLSVTLFAESGTGGAGPEALKALQFPGAGAEGVFDLAIGSDIPLRIRLGIGIPLRTGLGVIGGDPRGYVAFGPSF